MEQSMFKLNLMKATASLLPWMRTLVANDLPNECRYLVSLSASYFDQLLGNCSPNLGKPFSPPVEGFPESSTKMGLVRELASEDVAQLLWIDGAVPDWINVELHSADTVFTYIKLECCPRLSAIEDNLYHRDEGYPPFHILSGFLPDDWRDVERDGKFDLRTTRR